MKKKTPHIFLRSYLWIIMFMVPLLCTSNHEAKADLGPKPKIYIELPAGLTQDIAEGTLLECENADCSDAQPLPNLGPQGFECHLSEEDQESSQAPYGTCNGLAYGFSPYLQLQLTLKNEEKITSKIFTKKKFNAKFKASYTQGTLKLVEQ